MCGGIEIATTGFCYMCKKYDKELFYDGRMLCISCDSSTISPPTEMYSCYDSVSSIRGIYQ